MIRIIRRDTKSKRAIRTRSRVRGSAKVPRLTVFRSNRYIYAQLVDDDTGRTMASSSSLSLLEREKGKTKKEISFDVGLEISQKAKSQGIEKIVFDKGPYKYHGLIKELAEGARKGGLNF